MLKLQASSLKSLKVSTWHQQSERKRDRQPPCKTATKNWQVKSPQRRYWLTESGLSVRQAFKRLREVKMLTDSDMKMKTTRTQRSNAISCIISHLVTVTSWRLPPYPQEAASSWGLGPGPRQRRPVRRHGDQGTEGQHPVGSMPVKRRGEKKELSELWPFATAWGLIRTHYQTHSFHAICIFNTWAVSRTWHLTALYSHYKMITEFFVLVNWIISFT